MAKKITKKDALWWELKHERDIIAYQKKVKAEYKKSIDKIVTKMHLLPKELGDEPLSLDKYPVANEQIDQIVAELGKNVNAICTNGIREQWAMADKKNDMIIPLTAEVKEQMGAVRKQVSSIRSSEALSAFMDRRTAGLTISDRVWKYSSQYKMEIENGLDICIRDGVSATKMATRMKQYLVYPDKLFRRVRDEHGVLHLSKAAKAFHPGRGVYRSSFKNARRLVANETNVAYRLSDYQRWQEEDEVVGIEIKLSNNHTINGVPFTDMCDDLKGKYPKDFVFTGWHPLCRCYAVPILKTREERVDELKRVSKGEEPSAKSVNTVKDVPGAYKTYIATNTDRIERMKVLPDWAAYNEKYVPQLKLNSLQEQRLKDVTSVFHAVSQPSALDVAKIRHEARTPEQIAKIKEAWKKRISANITPGDTTNFNDVIDELANYPGNITYKDVMVRNKTLTTEEIIQRVAGGDMTKGSCASLAHAYAGNKAGYDVLDFRGGNSMEFFATAKNERKIADCVGGINESGYDGFKVVARVLSKVAEGKEYIFAGGEHAAIVRKMNGRLQYLELQSPIMSDNKFCDLTLSKLKSRFKVQRTRTFQGKKMLINGTLIDVELLAKDKGYKKILGYINTDATKQLKGVAGTLK